MRIATPEGVDLELTLAGIGSRFIAAILDFLLQITFIFAVAVVLDQTGRLEQDANAVGAALFAIAFFLTFFFYDVLFEVRSRGRTPGKRWTGLRVVRTGGRPVTLVPSCIRNVLRLIDILPSFYAIGMLSIFVTARNQRLGDLAAGTLVVRDRSGGLREPHRAPAAGPQFVNDVAWDVSAVSSQDLGTVRQFLDRRGDLSAHSRRELAEELERRLRPLVAGAPDRIGAEEFLERLSAAKASRA